MCECPGAETSLVRSSDRRKDEGAGGERMRSLRYVRRLRDRQGPEDARRDPH